MHKAMLYNYLGIPEMTGSEFQRVSRAQVQQQGGQIEDVEVTHAEKTDTGFAVTTANGDRAEGKYLVLSTGTNTKLAEGAEFGKEEQGHCRR